MPGAITADEVARIYLNSGLIDVRPMLARFVLEHRDEVRAIARSQLRMTTRSVYDSDEIVSTVLRRLDRFVQEGRFSPTSGKDVWTLVSAVTHNTAVSKVRLMERARALVREDGVYATMLVERLNRCQGDDEAASLVTRIMLLIPSEKDRQIVSLRLRGTTHKVTAQLLGLQEAAVRKRWSDTMAYLYSCVKQWENASW